MLSLMLEKIWCEFWKMVVSLSLKIQRMSKTALQTVQGFQMSMGSGTNDWTDLVSEKITFQGPVADVKGKAEFIELNKGFFPLVKGYEPINVFEQGNFVCLE